jgi:toxin ParE1/3/4
MIIWAPEAILDIREAHDFLLERNERAAERITTAIYEAGERLAHFPNRGRRGMLPGTRELIVHGTPYYLVYYFFDPGVEISRVIHHARDWPQRQ